MGLGRACWLVQLRNNVDGSGLAVYLSNAPATILSDAMGCVSAVQASSASDGAQQDAIGLDEYKVWSWQSWYHL